MKFRPYAKQLFPKSTRWIATNIPLVRKKANVVAAYKKYSAMDNLDFLKMGKLPYIDVSILPYDTLGSFNYKEPDRINISVEICSVFEQDPRDAADPRMHRLIEGVLMHEFVHWGLHQMFPEDEPTGEQRAAAFTLETYGPDSPYWWYRGGRRQPLRPGERPIG